VYGPDKWPYFGGEGWVEELLPALLRHPGFDGSTSRLRARIAHLHAFVVDVRPRTPQARRRLSVASNEQRQSSHLSEHDDARIRVDG
jgi:hypothetical protein